MADRLLVHPLCPYAQRALYAVSYKAIGDIQIEEVDLVHKPVHLLQANPSGLVPTLIRGKARPLYESLVLVDFFDSYPGPPIYPRLSDGSIDLPSKRILDSLIETLDRELGLYWVYFDTPSLSNAQRLSILAHKINAHVSGGHFFAQNLFHQDVVSAAEIAVFPFVERLVLVQDREGLIISETRCPDLYAWYLRLGREPWVRRHQASPGRLQRLVDESGAGEYVGLQLPVTRYD